MNQNELIKAIETLNKQINEISSSREYLLGKKIVNLQKKIKKGQFIEIVKDIKQKSKIKHEVRRYQEYNLPVEQWEKTLRVGNQEKKVVVYSCITGGYDKIREPYLRPDNVDYKMFLSESEDNKESTWESMKIPDKILALDDNILVNRYIKFHPFELFRSEYDIAIYIDGTISPVSDLSEYGEHINENVGIAMHSHQLRDDIYDEIDACILWKRGDYSKLLEQKKRYKEQGMPEHYGLLEANVIVSDLHNENAHKILDDWWNEYLFSGSRRDQIALPYILWKNGVTVSDVATLGRDVSKSTKLQISKSHG